MVETDDSNTAINYAALIEGMRDVFNSGKTRPIKWRIQQLKQIAKMIRETTSDIIAALSSDLRRHKFETFMLEIDYTLQEIEYTIMHIKEWSAIEKPSKGLAYIFDSVEIRKDPYGVVLIIGPWNYPLQLMLVPAIGAIAAGNCVILKPSEISSATATYLSETLPKYVDTECCQVVLGGITKTEKLLEHRFDYIFYTGSSMIGRIVREAANKYLTPVTLELGGKSPVYIDDTVDMSMAVKRILWGKCINAGQTCIAPDYILCTPEVQDKFVQEAKKILVEWYGKNPQESLDLTRVITDKHYQRLIGYLSDNGEIAVGGDVNLTEKYISPTILVGVKPTDPIMQEEIFGPILPIININNVYEAIKFIKNNECPLVLYAFSKSKKMQDLLIGQIRCGSICINDTIMQFGVDSIPFGGVGNSGMGAYHGKYTYDTFTHKKGCLIRNYNQIAEFLAKNRFPPYSNTKLKIISLLLAKRRIPGKKYLPYLLMFGAGVLVTIGFKSILKEFYYMEERM